jgi:hypothetical protein
MSEQEEGTVQFSPEDFRTWNKAGFEEVSAALAEARRRFTEAGSLREQELAQLRLDSLEQLYRLALQAARERFERARTDAAGRLRVVVQKLQAAPLPVVTADRLWQKVSRASEAFAAKRFDQALHDLVAVEAEMAVNPRRQMTSIPAKATAEPATASVAQCQAPASSGGLLGLAAQYEKNGRPGVACRLYLRALVQTASTAANRR